MLWIIGGQVQGVGFRPFVYRLAHEHRLRGWVRNRTGQVEILAQGAPADLQAFAGDLLSRAPPLARPVLLSSEAHPPADFSAFSILPSAGGSQPRIHVPPDYFVCGDCLRELRDPADRRHAYPFINCTQCGPRYTLITGLPYDRPRTTMSGFPLCPVCQAEYTDPGNRRFHAEPVACPTCGPRLEFKPAPAPSSRLEKGVGGEESPLAACIRALREGLIVAVKGIGGYHLLCDAGNAQTVARLRRRKPRPHKPLAVIFPGLEAVRESLAPTPEEAALLASPMRPIVLLPARRPDNSLAPGLKEIGAMLPYSPLHHLLLDAFGAPLVATSANLSGEPVLTEKAEVEQRLGHVADAFLHHDRPIARPADDPVFREIAGELRPLRLGRGCAPLELELPWAAPSPLLAVGGQSKNTVALAWENRVVISPHIGDLDSARGLAVFEQVIADLQELYQTRAEHIVCDAHPGYAASRWAKKSGLPVSVVFHHHAHASALAGEYPEIKDWLVFTWDGVGYGEDGTSWGGEALRGRPGRWQRVARLRPFFPPGGEKAGREPWRCAAAVCWESGMERVACLEGKLSVSELALLFHAWQRRLNCPQTTAAGRLFDAAAALSGLLHSASFEGQGPMLLEAAASGAGESIPLPLVKTAGNLWQTDWSPLLPRLGDAALSVAERAASFHLALAQAIAAQAQAVSGESPVEAVGLCGGVFQNRLLAGQASALLRQAGFQVFLPRRVPLNDAGISFGQIVERLSSAR
jgi:hydrogenase maturation protein HypF